MASYSLRYSIIRWMSVIFKHTLGRWAPAQGYASRFYNLMRAIDPKVRRRIVLIHIISTINGMVFLLGSLLIVPFINYLIAPETLLANKWVAIIQVWFVEMFAEAWVKNFVIFLGLFSIFGLTLTRVIYTAVEYLVSIMNVRLKLYYTTKLFYSYINQESHEDQASTSKIVQDIQNRLPGVLDNFVTPIFTIINQIFFIGTGLAVLILLNPALVLWGIVGGMLFVGGSIYATNRRVKKFSEIGDSVSVEANRLLFNSIGAREYIQLLGKQNLFAKRYSKVQEELAMNGLKLHLINLIFSPLSEIVIFSTMVIASIYIIYAQGIESIASATAFLIVLYRVLPSFNSFFGIFITLRQGITAYDRVADRLISALKTEVSYKAHVKNPLAYEEAVEIDNVFYKYPSQAEGEQALEDINLRIPQGVRIGVCGVSGGGKTTLLRLLMGRLVPNKGSLKVDGLAINDSKTIRRWQDNIGYVSQNLVLLDASLRDNITLSAPGERINKKLLEDAIDLAELRDMVDKLPDKERTIITEEGGNISGGQKQRIVIARALYNDPSLLILDEATSSLDKHTESKILNNIYKKWRKTGQKKTLIFVTHRLDTIKNSDMILLLSENKIKAQGTYQELMRLPQFRELTSEADSKDG